MAGYKLFEAYTHLGSLDRLIKDGDNASIEPELEEIRSEMNDAIEFAIKENKLKLTEDEQLLF